MTRDLAQSDLAGVMREARRLAGEATRVFGPLSRTQLNWKPAPGEWSVAQCVEHVVLSNRPYLPIFQEILEGRRRRRLWERVPGLPRLFARIVIRALDPDARRGAKARPAFLPSTSDVAADRPGFPG